MGAVTVENDVVIEDSKVLEVDGTLTVGNDILSDNSTTPTANDGDATLKTTTKGSIRVYGDVNVGATSGNIEILNTNSLVVDGTITCDTLKVGISPDAGKVEAKAIVATTSVDVAAGSTLTVDEGIESATVTVEDSSLRADTVKGALVIATTAATKSVTVVVPNLIGSVNDAGVTAGSAATITVGTGSGTDMTVEAAISSDATYAGTVTFKNGSKVAADTTLTLNGKVESIENLTAEKGATVVFGADADVRGEDSHLFVDNKGNKVDDRDLAGNTFVFDGKDFVVQVGSPAYKIDSTVAAVLDSTRIYA